MELRELLGEFGYDADGTPIICGSALCALEVGGRGGGGGGGGCGDCAGGGGGCGDGGCNGCGWDKEYR